jgi:hypothetical protein
MNSWQHLMLMWQDLSAPSKVAFGIAVIGLLGVISPRLIFALLLIAGAGSFYLFQGGHLE